jgi:hypothetical protein
VPVRSLKRRDFIDLLGAAAGRAVVGCGPPKAWIAWREQPQARGFTSSVLLWPSINLGRGVQVMGGVGRLMPVSKKGP